MKKYLFLGLLLYVTQTYAQLCFALADTSATFATFVAKADFNGDGYIDLVTDNLNSNYVSILLGTGTGSFSTATNYTVGNNPAELVVEDFNADGKLDLAVANQHSNNLSVLLGTGTGSFSATTNYAVGLAPYSITCADFNNDGKKDLATGNQGSPFSGPNNVSILLGTGTGSFAAAYTVLDYTTYGFRPISIANADFNMDNNIDLALIYTSTTNQTNFVYISLGTGAGTFDSLTPFSVGSSPNYVIAKDFNNDNKVDIATTNGNSNNISVRLGNGNGIFSSPTNYTVGAYAQYMTVADFNKDGLVDLAVNNSSSQTVSVLLGAGSGNFNPAVNFAVGNSGVNEDIVSGDFNGDSLPDLAVSSTNVYILLNCTTMGIEEFANNSKIKLYPNPVQNNLTIEVNDKERQQLQIVDISGKVILTKNLQGSNTLDVTNLENGVYFVQLKNNMSISTHKIIVQR
ncbi:MAG TPA: T9SS type A sorting domain-containing protein [Bacteroidia bacterium]|nr:T9SS type A sorting domain-containing protein [Bacteroidia bacterium]